MDTSKLIQKILNVWPSCKIIWTFFYSCLGFALKCQVCESESYGVLMTGVCKDKDDNGESKECQPHENICFFTKTGITFMFFIVGLK